MTPDTKELLTYAAKAAGIELIWDGDTPRKLVQFFEDFRHVDWNPTTTDGDSARLRTELGIFVAWPKRGRVYLYFTDENGLIVLDVSEMFSDHSGDKNAALRWATLRLAAEIGRRMKDD